MTILITLNTGDITYNAILQVAPNKSSLLLKNILQNWSYFASIYFTILGLILKDTNYLLQRHSDNTYNDITYNNFT
jgi:hypothetical protein